MTHRLDDRGAIVTGAGSGIGLEIARRLHAAGAAVTLLDINVAAVHDLARSLGPRGIRVNAIAPGLIDTPLTTMLTQPPLRDEFLDNTPLGRIGTAADVAAAALFLASDDSAWITGDMLLVDGGGHTKRYPELARRFAGQDR
jgi:NAD(P)-dependent dehydrogenase (short-subunit alcohol dehydrogenase family)